MISNYQTTQCSQSNMCTLTIYDILHTRKQTQQVPCSGNRCKTVMYCGKNTYDIAKRNAEEFGIDKTSQALLWVSKMPKKASGNWGREKKKNTLIHSFSGFCYHGVTYMTMKKYSQLKNYTTTRIPLRYRTMTKLLPTLGMLCPTPNLLRSQRLWFM